MTDTTAVPVARPSAPPVVGGRATGRRPRFGSALAHLAISCSAVLFGLIASTERAQAIGGVPSGLAAWVAVVGAVEAAAVRPAGFTGLPLALAAALFTAVLGPRFALPALGLAGLVHGTASMLAMYRSRAPR